MSAAHDMFSEELGRWTTAEEMNALTADAAVSETEYIHQLEGWLAQVRARSESLLTERNSLRAELAALKEDLELQKAMLCEASYEVFNGPRHDWSGKTLDEWLAYLEEEVRQSEPDRWAEREKP